MFTRIVECQVKPDKRDELKDRLRSEVLPPSEATRICGFDRPGIGE
jgi:hypothetical protein